MKSISVNKNELKLLFCANDIQLTWNASQNLKVIFHPLHGMISPVKYRQLGKGKPCPYCARKMVIGKDIFSTNSEKIAIDRGYQYLNSDGRKYINKAGSEYFHPNYVTLDHKINKARCPEKMFDFDNLELICWRCNMEKGDNNAYELSYYSEYLSGLAETTISKYQPL